MMRIFGSLDISNRRFALHKHRHEGPRRTSIDEYIYAIFNIQNHFESSIKYSSSFRYVKQSSNVHSFFDGIGRVRQTNCSKQEDTFPQTTQVVVDR
jgi:hypothetical protein